MEIWMKSDRDFQQNEINRKMTCAAHFHWFGFNGRLCLSAVLSHVEGTHAISASDKKLKRPQFLCAYREWRAHSTTVAAVNLLLSIDWPYCISWGLEAHGALEIEFHNRKCLFFLLTHESAVDYRRKVFTWKRRDLFICCPKIESSL